MRRHLPFLLLISAMLMTLGLASYGRARAIGFQMANAPVTIEKREESIAVDSRRNPAALDIQPVSSDEF